LIRAKDGWTHAAIVFDRTGKDKAAVAAVYVHHPKGLMVLIPPHATNKAAALRHQKQT
jgi:hypothetical protein